MNKTLSLLLILIKVFCCVSCPPWTLPYSSAEDNTTQCKCGDDLGGVVHCDRDTLQVSLLHCYCMTQSEDLNLTLVGHCAIMCLSVKGHIGKRLNRIITNTTQSINSEVCGPFNRKGQLCGECIEGHGPPVYSYSFQCVKCDKANFKYNLLKYIAVAFLPLTGFYLVVMVFKIQATASFIVAYVMMCQIATTPFMVRRLLIRNNMLNRILATLFGIWNLEIYAPFCVHPDMTTLQVLALDYMVGVYPLVLIAVTYIAVMLHDRHPLVVRLWRPVNRLCMCIRREWDIRGSLVQAFATFLVLSYVKILNVSFDLLTPVFLQTPEGEYLNQSYLYNAGETPYFRREHLPYGVLAVVMLTVFNILPVILLFLYPCSCCHKCLNCCHLSNPALHTFMDTFQGCYHHKPRERRYFAALYLLVRLLQSIIFAFIKHILFLSVMGFCLVLLVILISIFKPYKQKNQNVVDEVILLILAMAYFLNVSLNYAILVEKSYAGHLIRYLMGSSMSFLAIYSLLILLWKFVPAKLVSTFKNFKLSSSRQDASTLNESLPHRLEYSTENSPLLV